MARIFYITIQDPFALGVRQMAAYTKPHGHQSFFCFLRNEGLDQQVTKFAENQADLKYIGGRIYSLNSDNHRSLSIAEEKQVQKLLHSFKPEIIAYSGRMMVADIVPALFRICKNAMPYALLVCGGHGPSLNPEYYLRHGADLAFRGEGEQAMLDLCQAIDRGKSVYTTHNAVWLDKDGMHYNPMYPLVLDIEQFPKPFIDESKAVIIADGIAHDFAKWNQSTSYDCLTSRGCMGKCSYCAATAWRTLYKNNGLRAPRVRLKSQEYLRSELLEAKKKGYRFIRFADDYFVRPAKELISFMQWYNTEIALAYHAYFHHDQLLQHPELFELAIKHLSIYKMGIQSGSKFIAEDIYNRKLDKHSVLAIIKQFQSRYIGVALQFITGQPLDTPETFAETLNFIHDLPFSDKMVPSLRLTCNKFRVGESILLQKYPELQHKQCTKEEWLRESVLMHLRLICTDEEFDAIRGFQGDPLTLHTYFNQLHRHKHFLYVQRQAKRLLGKRVLFWGDGESRRSWRSLFTEVTPVGMILDEPWRSQVGPTSSDGLPVLSPQQAAQGGAMPVILFASAFHMRTLARAAYAFFPDLGDDLVTCLHQGRVEDIHSPPRLPW